MHAPGHLNCVEDWTMQVHNADKLCHLDGLCATSQLKKTRYELCLCQSLIFGVCRRLKGSWLSRNSRSTFMSLPEATATYMYIVEVHVVLTTSKGGARVMEYIAFGFYGYQSIKRLFRACFASTCTCKCVANSLVSWLDFLSDTVRVRALPWRKTSCWWRRVLINECCHFIKIESRFHGYKSKTTEYFLLTLACLFAQRMRTDRIAIMWRHSVSWFKYCWPKVLRVELFSFVFVSQIREEKEFDNLAKMYVADLIKRECWDCMVVKGRGLNAFHNDLEVSNYPLRERPRATLERLERVKEFRRVEMEELKVRQTHTSPSHEAHTHSLMQDYMLP